MQSCLGSERKCRPPPLPEVLGRHGAAMTRPEYDAAWDLADRLVTRAFDVASSSGEAIIDFNLAGERLLVETIAEALRERGIA